MVWVHVVEMPKSSMNAKFVYSSGTVPEICWFPRTSMVLSIERFSTSDGRLPLRSLRISDNTSSRVQLSSSDGMLPLIGFLFSQSPTDAGKEVSGRCGVESVSDHFVLDQMFLEI